MYFYFTDRIIDDGYIDTNILPTTYEKNCKNEVFDAVYTRDLLSWAFQVARGMEYISQKKV